MNQQERIHKYLSQEMDTDELARFKAEMVTNSDLSEAVDLQRDISTFFKERTPGLASILEEEGAQHFKEQTRKNRFRQWKWLLPILIVPFGLALWWSQKTISHLTPKEKSPATLERSTIDKKAPFLVDTIYNTPPPSKEKFPTPSDKQPNNAPKPSNKKELIASVDPTNFQLNPIIESILSEQVRARGSITELETPVKDTTFSFAPTISFQVSGTAAIAPPYTLSIYSNRVFDFENEYKVLSASLTGTPLGENYSFSFNANVPFPKGLYYLFLQTEEEGGIIHISRFKVE